MSKNACYYCKYRNSWDCEDGWGRREGCEYFVVDGERLSRKQNRTIQKILEKENREYYYV